MSDAASYFDRLYRASQDPWNYETSPYEAQKYASTLAGLRRPHYGTIIEPGCSIGVLSVSLAQRCDRLISLDFSPLAVNQAKDRLKPFGHATAMVGQLPQDWPSGTYDLIVLSEIIYYLARPEIEALARHVVRDAADGAECVIVHYQGETQTEISANEARDIFCATLRDFRKFIIAEHPSDGNYNHRTLVFSGLEFK